MVLPRKVFAQQLADALFPLFDPPQEQRRGTPLVLTETVRRRGGKKSRRTTARVWEPKP